MVTPVLVSVLIARLEEADELETARRIAGAWEMSGVEELLQRRPPRHPAAHAIVDLYQALEAHGHGTRRIAQLTGRDRSSVVQGLKYHGDDAWKARRRAVAKLSNGQRVTS